MMFEIRNLRSDDRRAYNHMEAFLLANPDPGVRIRPHEQLDAALKTGQGLMVQQGERLVGVSLIYKFAEPEGPVFSELGTMRVTANGFGLQSFVAWIHLFQIGLEEYPDCLAGTFAVVSPDSASEYVLKSRVGMGEWMPPPALRRLRADAQVPFNPDKSVLLADEATWDLAVKRLRGLHLNDRTFRTPKGGASVEFLPEWFSPRLLDVDFGRE